MNIIIAGDGKVGSTLARQLSSESYSITLIDSNPKVLVCAVPRNGTAVAPGGNFVLREGDRIFVTATTQSLTVLLKNLCIITRRVRRMILCGGGRVSYYLASALEKSGITVQLIEKNLERCQSLCEQLPECDIVHGDTSDLELLESEGIERADALVTLTGRDELNMIVSLYAGSKGVPQVITKLGHADNRNIIDSLNLGSVVCPKELCCTTIVRYVRAMQNQTGAAISLHTIADGQAEAVEFLVDEKVLDNTNAYLAAYVVILFLVFTVISLDGFSVGTNFSATLCTFNNIGPGLEAVGPTCNFSGYSDLSTLVLSFAMLAGRLEIFPILVLFSRSTWKHR